MLNYDSKAVLNQDYIQILDPKFFLGYVKVRLEDPHREGKVLAGLELFEGTRKKFFIQRRRGLVIKNRGIINGQFLDSSPSPKHINF